LQAYIATLLSTDAQSIIATVLPTVSATIFTADITTDGAPIDDTIQPTIVKSQL